MRTIERPIRFAKDVVRVCISNIRDRDLVDRVTSVEGILEADEDIYIRSGESKSLHLIPGKVGIEGAVTTAEMIALYNDKFGKLDQPPRFIYDEIRASSPNNICPFCAARKVKTIDHYLPKTSHPQFSVTPINLVPSCSDCNKDKHALVSSVEGEQILHPYFDQIDDFDWLAAKVEEGIAPVILFSISVGPHWPRIIQDRLKWHFEKLKLSELYTTYAQEELSDIRIELVEVAASGGGVLYDHLDRRFRSCWYSARNSWRTASYRALKNSQWFLDIGHSLI